MLSFCVGVVAEEWSSAVFYREMEIVFGLSY